MREIRFDSNNQVLEINPFLDCGAAVIVTTFPFECDNPMDLQFGADGNFYLLTYGDGFFQPNADAGMYRWEYTKGPQAPQAVVSATPTNGQAPLNVQFSSEGSGDDDPGDSITFAWDFDTRTPSVDSTDPNPRFTYTANGRLHGPPDGDGLDREDGVRQHGDHGGQHRADADDQHAARR